MRAFVTFLAGMLLFVALGVIYLTSFDPSRTHTVLQTTTSECAMPIPPGQPGAGGCPAGP
jgi:hypothetical protein